MGEFTFDIRAHPPNFLQILTICEIIWSTMGARIGVSDDERRLYKYFRCRNELKWMRTEEPRCHCQFVCPPEHYVVTERIRIQEILLEAPGCKKFEAEILDCFCGFRPAGRHWLRGDTHVYAVSGLRGEIYELCRADGICGDFKTWVIKERMMSEHEHWPEMSCFDKVLDCLTAPIRLPTLWWGDRYVDTSDDD